MKPSAYHHLLETIGSAKHLLDTNAGELTAADLRIRCLVNITLQESRRALLESEAAERSSRAAFQSDEAERGADQSNAVSRHAEATPAH